MKIFKKIPEELDAFEGQVVIAIVGSDERPLKATNAWLDWRLFGSISELLIRGVFKGDVGERCLIPTYGKFEFDRLIMLGGGEIFSENLLPTSDLGREHWMKLGSLIDEVTRSLKVEKLGLSLPRFDLIDHEKALLQSLQMSSLRADSSLFLARAPHASGLQL